MAEMVTGWPAVWALIAIEFAAMVVLVRYACRRWLDLAIIVALTVAALPPTERYLTGDVSRWLPWAMWSGGSDGKDQIIIASVASTLLLPPIAIAMVAIAGRWLWRAVRPLRTPDAR